eukprot:TRINITY_DN12195_c0_g1_i1.p1 TRINITY_DN12195_c0_g1~~TRINITY_DN12195_c0_g1_i1.p1  ORF type:complete len:527 (+),score=158.78 TRINITY_DN12195_c0_g1_i1:122-1702(+)
MFRRNGLALKKSIEKKNMTGKRLTFSQEKRLTAEEQKGSLQSYTYEGWKQKSDPGLKIGPFGEGYHGKGKSNDRLYYGGGDRLGEQFNADKAKAWRSLKADAIAETERSMDYSTASSTPLVTKQKRSKTVVDWENMTMDMPVAGTAITSRKHSTLEHLVRLRINAKYRWKQERFVVRKAAAVNHLAQHKYFPELLALDKRTKPPRDINLDKQPVIFVDEFVLNAAGGGDGTDGMIAEYFIPEEPLKSDLFHNDDVSLKRVAVMVGIQDPTHLGTMIRSAVGLGCDAIILMEKCADPYSQPVLDVSMAAQVTAGGYPRFHTFREEDGDDPWGILNRMIKKHNMIPVLSATAPEDKDASITPDAFWRERFEADESEAPLCIFFGDEKHGLDVDYCKHNTSVATHQLTVSCSSALGLSTSAQSAVLLHHLMEPTYVSATPAEPMPLRSKRAAKLRMMSPVTREIQEARRTGEPMQLADVRAPTMSVTKSYKSQLLGSPAYKTQVDFGSPAEVWAETIEEGRTAGKVIDV